ncbi:hypothetical protein LCGC14_1137780 [marine sediment metagenome]|uniref:Uncharacterized protein n=1 Tax=marine sediment metagenome TaxID=412755 RepID=A0A0F9M409_9ZZZZ
MQRPPYMPDVWLVPWQSLLSIKDFEAHMAERQRLHAD